MEPIPIVVVTGSHRAAGRVIGEVCAAEIAAELAEALAEGDPDALRARVEPYLAAARRHVPAVVEELAGCAEGAGVELVDLAVLVTEELYTASPARVAGAGCTDVSATAPATVGGETILAHTNDLAPSARDRLVALDRRVDGEPRILTVGVGPVVSAGMNASGVALGGNQLDANDERVGIPRSLLVRELLARRTAADAIRVALHPERASSYANVVGGSDGTLVGLEASATAYAVDDAAAGDGTIAHTNHYADPAMARYELAPEDAEHSRGRLARARALLAASPRPLTEDALLAILADRTAPCPIARDAGACQTVFWCVLNPSAGRMRFGRGAPGAADAGPEQVVTLR